MDASSQQPVPPTCQGQHLCSSAWSLAKHLFQPALRHRPHPALVPWADTRLPALIHPLDHMDSASLLSIIIIIQPHILALHPSHGPLRPLIAGCFLANPLEKPHSHPRQAGSSPCLCLGSHCCLAHFSPSQLLLQFVLKT